MSPDLAPGSTLGDYRIERVLGQGGMGTVYRAERTRLGQTVALKVLSPTLGSDPAFRARFEREWRLAAGLRHPNIVPIFDAGEVDGVLYLAMLYVEGSDLRELLDRAGPLEPRRALGLLAQVGSALDVAHAQGLVHRDIKPPNILVASGQGPESTDHVYLADFGLTKRTTSQSGLTQMGSFVGTLDYIAPEQIQGRPVDGRADIYALGCVLYECLAGEVPYDRDSDAALLYAHLHDPLPSLSARHGELPAALDSVVATATAKDPDDRYPTAQTMIAAARAALTIGDRPSIQGATVPVAWAEAASASAAISGNIPDQHGRSSHTTAPGALVFDDATTPMATGAITRQRGAETTSSRRGPLIVVVLVVAAVIGGGGLFAALNLGPPSESGGETGSIASLPPPEGSADVTGGPTTSAGPVLDEGFLRANVPAAFGDTCDQASSLPPVALHGIACEVVVAGAPDTADAGLYLFRSDEDLVDWYADRRRRERDAGRLQPCAAGLPLSWEWPGTDGTPGGRLLCFVTPGNYAHIRWIRYDVPIGGGASGPTPDGDIGYVYGWWRDQLNAPYISVEVP